MYWEALVLLKYLVLSLLMINWVQLQAEQHSIVIVMRWKWKVDCKEVFPLLFTRVADKGFLSSSSISADLLGDWSVTSFHLLPFSVHLLVPLTMLGYGVPLCRFHQSFIRRHFGSRLLKHLTSSQVIILQAFSFLTVTVSCSILQHLVPVFLCCLKSYSTVTAL